MAGDAGHSGACPLVHTVVMALFISACLSGVEGARLARAAGKTPPDAFNDRPIIGILSQPGPPSPKGMSYIAASYVKWVEAAGARVVPILYDMTEGEVRARFRIINGLLLPGGGARLEPGHPFYDTAALLFDLALDANDAGDYFPVWGTCLGLETLAILASQNYTLLADTEAEDAAAPLLYTDEADGSRFISALPPSVVRNLQDRAIAMENHAHGVLMTAYEENSRLASFFKVLALSIARDGLPYVSLMEGREYPVWAQQFHPEKSPFEWTPSLHIPHSPAAIEMSQEVANFFVGEARRNTHAAKDEVEEDSVLIYNWRPHFTGRHEHGGEEQDFEQCYFFDSEDLPERRASVGADTAAERERAAVAEQLRPARA